MGLYNMPKNPNLDECRAIMEDAIRLYIEEGKYRIDKPKEYIIEEIIDAVSHASDFSIILKQEEK